MNDRELNNIHCAIKNALEKFLFNQLDELTLNHAKRDVAKALNELLPEEVTLHMDGKSTRCKTEVEIDHSDLNSVNLKIRYVPVECYKDIDEKTTVGKTLFARLYPELVKGKEDELASKYKQTQEEDEGSIWENI